jgi:hypothetical protein
VLEWVRQYVNIRSFTGQIAFDMIKCKKDGKLYAIECNPRGTSGIHLFQNYERELTNCFLEENCEPIIPNHQDQDYQVTAAMFIWCIFFFDSIKNLDKLYAWISTVWKCNDTIFEWWDPLPWFSQFLIALEPFWKVYRLGIAYVDTFTYDIEWNGE